MNNLPEWNGYRVDPERGIVYGIKGEPLTANARGHILIVRKHKHVGYAHRAVWEVVHGPIPEWMQINHKNGIKWDNRIENLEVVTPKENTLHAYRTGLLVQPKGEKSKVAKLTAADVANIRARASNGSRVCEIAKDYPNVSAQHIGRIINRRARNEHIAMGDHVLRLADELRRAA